jgi:hypothetical protein
MAGVGVGRQPCEVDGGEGEGVGLIYIGRVSRG